MYIKYRFEISSVNSNEFSSDVIIKTGHIEEFVFIFKILF